MERKKEVYSSLEQINEDLEVVRGIWDHDLADEELDEVLTKLQATIAQGGYLQTDGTK